MKSLCILIKYYITPKLKFLMLYKLKLNQPIVNIFIRKNTINLTILKLDYFE